MKVKLITYTPNPEKVIAMAAKLCYTSSDLEELEEDINKQDIDTFIYKLETLHHYSPFEHASFTFGVEGVSRSFLAQLTRHRLASYSVQSQRYVDKSNFNPVEPEIIKNNKLTHDKFVNIILNENKSYVELLQMILLTLILKEYPNEFKKSIIDFYKMSNSQNTLTENQVDYKLKNIMEDINKSSYISLFSENHKKEYNTLKKIAQENARSVLPNACDTKIIFTMNLRELYHFFNLRCCNRAQDEIRTVADEMLILCKKVSPLLFQYAGPSCVADGCKEGKMSCGHPYKKVNN